MAAGGDDVLIVRDIDKNGLITDGSELMGEGTFLEYRPGARAGDGFEALAQFDRVSSGGNADGWIDNQDLIWDELLIWNDVDANAKTSAGELLTLSSIGVARLSLQYSVESQLDEAGNDLRLWSTATGIDGAPDRDVVDVFFSGICLDLCE